MTDEEQDVLTAKVDDLLLRDELRDADEILHAAVEKLFKEKDYARIISLYDTNVGRDLGVDYFEFAYALVEKKRKQEAENIYERILSVQPRNSAVLNNLSNLKKERGKLKEAFSLITRAKECGPDDEIVCRNYDSLLRKVQEIEAKETAYKDAAAKVMGENQFVREKLSNFVNAFKTDPDFYDGRMPIPNWKFKAMMKTDEYKADSLKEQWIRKSYILNTGEKAEHFVSVYEINPYIGDALQGVEEQQINPAWIKGIDRISVESLNQIDYFKIRKELNGIGTTIRDILVRDYDELVVNYLFDNHKAIVVLAGAFIESLLINYCEKNGIDVVSISVGGKDLSRPVYDADLGDLLAYFERQKTFSSHIMHLGNASRLFRNYIHPGKELREDEQLDGGKSNLCFIVVNEIIKKVVF